VSDLDVVDGDNRLIFICYNQVLLHGTLIDLDIPDRRSIDLAFGHRRTAKICLNQ
jgi:hypothetical protein